MNERHELRIQTADWSMADSSAAGTKVVTDGAAEVFGTEFGAVVLFWQGGTLNTMVLAGLVIALGEVVDDAIIDVENIIRRLRLNAKLEHPRSAFSVVLHASLEVRSAVVYGTMIVILAFLPVFFLEGLAGSFFRPLATSCILATLSSLAVALTLTPALSLLLSLILLPGIAARQEKESVLIRSGQSRIRQKRPTGAGG